jgi:rhamnose transport system ATP-binding protein
LKTLLRLENLTKSFGAVRALKGVSFDLVAGEVHALVGENGAGKSTLIKIVTGAERPDGGSIEIDGVPVRRLDPASAHALGIAAIYQQPALFPDLSVAENIALGLEPPAAARRVRWKERRTRADVLLERVGAEIDPTIAVRQLSMPQQQLVEIARALGAGARMLLMDEPTASLTDREAKRLQALIRDLRSQGVGIIYISHRLEEVFQVANRVTVLRDGETVGVRSLGCRQRNRTSPSPLREGRAWERKPSLPPGPGDSEASDDLRQAETPTTDKAATEEAGLTEAELIHLMVGREISTIFPPPENAPREVVISIRDLSCRESGVHGVNLEVRSGEVLGLAGLVGAGRTELARVLFGITPPDSGTVTLEGRRLHLRSPADAVAAGIAYVSEDRRRHGVILEMTLAANATLAILPRLSRRGWLSFGTERALTQDYIRDLGIKALSPDTRAGELSGGNQQKLALARWLAAKPKVLLLDEPTQGVDIGAKAEIHKLIRRLAAQGLAVLMISSELPEILGMSDRIAVMRKGTVTTVLERRDADAHSVMAAALG